MKKRLLSMLLVLLMLVQYVPTSVFAAEKPETQDSKMYGIYDIWDGSVASRFAGGSGTASDPYLISNGAELAKLIGDTRSKVNATKGKYYLLTNHIFLNDISDFENWEKTPPKNVWTPIGTDDISTIVYGAADHKFTGNFDGNGYGIFGLYVNRPDAEDGSGLFGSAARATIKNLTISKAYIQGGSYTAGFVGDARGPVAFENCCFDGVVKGVNNVGGIAGYDINNTYKYCCNHGTIEGADSVGGILGNMYFYGEIDYCYNTGTVTANYNAGGICGVVQDGNSGTSYVRNCYNAGEIRATTRNSGGIVGNFSHDRTMSNCYNVGKIICDGDSGYAGGIIGDPGFFISVGNCYYLDTSAKYGIAGFSKSTSRARTLSQMKEEATYAGFDFGGVWYFDEESDYDFPGLKFPELSHDLSLFKLPLFEIGDDPNSDADDKLIKNFNAIVTVYDGDAVVLTAKDKDGDGVVSLDLSKLTTQQIERATVSAVVSYDHCLTPEDNRYPLFKQFGTDARGNAKRYVLELHSETIDPNGNWCGESLMALVKAKPEARRLTLKEPRMRVNLAVAYREITGSQNQKDAYREKVKKSISDFSGYLAEATDGHVMVNKVLIGHVDHFKDFFFSISDNASYKQTVKLASMADIQIRLDENEWVYSIHSAAVTSIEDGTGGFHVDNAYVADGDFKNIFMLDTDPQGSDKGSFWRIRMAAKPYELSSACLGNAVYAKRLTHEAGHYILNFKDEYLNGENEDWSTKKSIRAEGAPPNFGLMDREWLENAIEISNSASYSYLNGDYNTASTNTAHSLFYKKSCEEVLAEDLVDYVREKLGYGADYSERGDNFRTAKYAYAALSDDAYIEFDAEQLAYPAETTSVMSLRNTETADADEERGAEELDFETAQVTTDGYLYFTPAETVYLYVVPEETTEYTFTEGTTGAENGDYRAVNQSVIIEAEEGEQTVQGELYSVAPIDEDIDYESVQWFVCQDGSWQALDTDLTREENGNIGARCDYAGAGEYVVMARAASEEGLLEITDVTWSQSMTRDAVIDLQFTDPNAEETVNHYRIYVSDTTFDETQLDQVEFIRYETTDGTASVELTESDLTAYVAVVAVGFDGAKSPLSEVVTVTTGYADSDQDGIPDWYCDKYLLWSTEEGVSVAHSDKDGDTLTNMEEYLQGTNPADPYDPSFEITWVVGDKVTTETYRGGVLPKFKGNTDKAADAQYTYTFVGWEPEIEMVTGDATYTARYEKTLNEYTVAWSIAGTITTEVYKYGEMPICKVSTDREADQWYTYTFNGWNKELSPVTGDVTYTAQYISEVKDGGFATVGGKAYASFKEAFAAAQAGDTIQLLGKSEKMVNTQYLHMAGSPITVTGEATLAFEGVADLRVKAGQTLRFEDAVILNGNPGASYRGFEHYGTIELLNSTLETNSLLALSNAIVKMDMNSFLSVENRLTFAADAKLIVDVTDLAGDGVAKQIVQGTVNTACVVLTGKGAENTVVYAEAGALYVKKQEPPVAVANGIYYVTLAEAVAAADEVTLLADIAEEIVVDKAMTIVKNGFTAVITAGEDLEVEETETAYVVKASEVDETDPITFTTSVTANCVLENELILRITPQMTGFPEDFDHSSIYDRVGIMIWWDKTTEKNAVFEYANVVYYATGFDAESNRYEIFTDGVPAKEMGRSFSCRPFYVNANGEYVYGRFVADYSVQKYVGNSLKKSDTEIVPTEKALLVALLNYGTAAQNYFNYRKDKPSNSILTAAQKAYTWDESLVRTDWSIPAAKEGTLTRDKKFVTGRAASMDLEGAINYNWIYRVSGTVTEASALVWTESQYKAATVLTEKNATVYELPSNGDNSYMFTYEGLAAKEMFKPVYVCGKFVDGEGNVHYTGVLAYCPERYGTVHMNDSQLVTPKPLDEALARTLIIYGDAARAHFGAK